jgi:hypothetical protein
MAIVKEVTDATSNCVYVATFNHPARVLLT